MTSATPTTRKSRRTTSPVIPTFTPAVLAAAQQFIRRRDRREHPDGKTDNANRWYPAKHERTAGCAYVRSPTRAWPWSLMVHCRTASHVAELHGVEKGEVRKAARVLDKIADGSLLVRKNSTYNQYLR